MRLAISNIAWRPEEAADIYPILAAAGVEGLEIAPGLTFAGAEDAFAPSAQEAKAFLDVVAAHGLRLVSMQSLLFGVNGAKLFGAPEERAAFDAGLRRAIGLAERLGIPNLVVGSPANRVIPDGMPRATAEAIAADAFSALGEVARAAGAVLALEPNPAAYGTNFLNTMEETIAFAATVNHASVGVNFDIGALHMNGEAAHAGALYERGARLVSHVHVSEPQLAPAPADEVMFSGIAAALISQGCEAWFSIEMRQSAPDNRPVVRDRVQACARALAAAS
ncbi:MAG: TIM barrel protein [Alphaproteobacteria bacterium]|nr:TIM barrel protein [Alphaproteobacteria bacterium]